MWFLRFSRNTLFENRHYRLTFYKGSSDVGVVAFAGIGLKMGGTQIEEFKASLGTDANCFFLIDKKRSWWNSPGLDDVFRTIDKKVAELSLRKISAVGSSMGGSGALLLAAKRDYISRCVSFVPQADVGHPHEHEKRWEKFWCKVRTFTHGDFAVPANHCRTIIVYGAQGEDYHIQKFTKSGMKPFVYKGCGHNAAQYMKQNRMASYRRLIKFITFQPALGRNQILAATS